MEAAPADQGNNVISSDRVHISYKQQGLSVREPSLLNENTTASSPTPFAEAVLLEEVPEDEATEVADESGGGPSLLTFFGKKISRKWVLFFSGGLLLLVVVGAVVGGVCGSGNCSSGTETRESPDTGFQSFGSLEELADAVNEYLADGTESSAVAAKFGHPIGVWSVSEVDSFESLFSSERNSAVVDFDEDLSGWNTSRAESMIAMFQGAISFKRGIGTWDVSSVTDTSNMFFGARLFNEDLSGWQVKSLSTMNSMFDGAAAFNHSLCSWRESLPNHNLSMTNMFRNSGCPITDGPDKDSVSSGPFCHDCAASPTFRPIPTSSPGPTLPPSLSPSRQPSRQPSAVPTFPPSALPSETPEAGFLPHCIVADDLRCSDLPLLLEACSTKVIGMSFVFFGYGCGEVDGEISRKDPSYECMDRNGGPPNPSDGYGVLAYLVVTDAREQFTFFSGWLGVGDTFSLDDRGFGFGIHQRVKIYNSSDVSADNMLQEVLYHSYICSGTFERMDYIGSLQLVTLSVREDPSYTTELPKEVDSSLVFSAYMYAPGWKTMNYLAFETDGKTVDLTYLIEEMEIPNGVIATYPFPLNYTERRQYTVNSSMYAYDPICPCDSRDILSFELGGTRTPSPTQAPTVGTGGPTMGPTRSPTPPPTDSPTTSPTTSCGCWLVTECFVTGLCGYFDYV